MGFLVATALFGFPLLCSFLYLLGVLKSEKPLKLAISLVRFVILIWFSLLGIQIQLLFGEKNVTEKPSEYDAALS